MLIHKPFPQPCYALLLRRVETLAVANAQQHFLPFFFSSLYHHRTEPQCITCDGDLLFASRYYYDNCSHFGAFVAPQSSISTDAGVEYYILECLGPGLPLAGECHVLKTLSTWKSALAGTITFHDGLISGSCFAVCTQKEDENQLPSTSFSCSLVSSSFVFLPNRCTLSEKSPTYKNTVRHTKAIF